MSLASAHLERVTGQGVRLAILAGIVVPLFLAPRENADIGLADLQSPPLRPSAADLAGIAVPALVLAGTTSHPAFRSVARRLAAALPDSRFMEIEGSGHVTYAERPDAFFTAVSAFAAEVDRREPVTAAPPRGGEGS